MKMPWFLQNDWVKWVWWIAALEWINTLASNFHWLYNAEIWDLIGSVAWAVDSWLEMTWINSVIASFEKIASGASGLGAMALSNKIMKDFGFDSWEWKTFWMKNLLRYWVNTTAAVWAFSAWSAALPYIIWGSITYWAGKHGWKWWKEWFKRSIWTAWGLTWWAVKWALKWAKNWAKWEQRINPNIS